MGIRKYNPTTPSLRQMTVSTFEEIDKVAPERSLLRPLHSKGQNNSQTPWRRCQEKIQSYRFQEK